MISQNTKSYVAWIPVHCMAQCTEPLALEDFGKETGVLILWAKIKQSSFQYCKKKTSLSHKQELIDVFFFLNS